MANVAKCPHCGVIWGHDYSVKVEPINAGQYAGVSYYCSNCETSLGVSLDPLALDSDLLRKMKKLLQPDQDSSPP